MIQPHEMKLDPLAGATKGHDEIKKILRKSGAK